MYSTTPFSAPLAPGAYCRIRISTFFMSFSRGRDPVPSPFLFLIPVLCEMPFHIFLFVVKYTETKGKSHAE